MKVALRMVRSRIKHGGRAWRVTLSALALGSAALVATPGCSRLMVHPKPVVSVPATVGGWTGAVAGPPLALAMLPVTGPIDLAISASGGGDTGIAAMPLAIPSYTLATALGGPSWLVFGWWGLPDDDFDPDVDFGSPRIFIQPLDPLHYAGYGKMRRIQQRARMSPTPTPVATTNPALGPASSPTPPPVPQNVPTVGPDSTRAPMPELGPLETTVP